MLFLEIKLVMIVHELKSMFLVMAMIIFLLVTLLMIHLLWFMLNLNYKAWIKYIYPGGRGIVNWEQNLGRLTSIGEFRVTAKTWLLIFPLKTYFPLYPHDDSSFFPLLHSILFPQAISLPPFFISTNTYSISCTMQCAKHWVYTSE